jgi:membrane protein
MKSRISKTLAVLRGAAAEAREDDVPTLARALAYSLFLAIPASMLVLLGTFSLVADAHTIASVVDRAEAVMPGEVAQLLSDSLERSSESTRSGLAMTIVGFVLALWTTTSAATTLMKGITIALDGEESRSFVRRRLLAILIVLALVLAAALVVAFLVLGPHLERWLGDAIGLPTLTAWLWWTLQWPLLVGGLLFAFSAVLYLGPDVPQPRWKLISPGAVTAMLVWLAASAGFAVYSANFGSYEKTWGTLSAVVVTLIWLWLTSAALLFGAEVNAEATTCERASKGEVVNAAPLTAVDQRTTTTVENGTRDGVSCNVAGFEVAGSSPEQKVSGHRG